ncbi:MAG: Mur ligase domain-containing protein [Rickettsiales bacterium]|jgi:UDP-N-acetylmuramate--alanine ligase|nr:Mur ligase domain-containing protein [Rickettsiales bacterium]
MKRVHFLGINGSGIVGVACLAKLNGYSVSGCDLTSAGNYSKQLLELGIEVEVGHSKEHLKNQDMLVVSPAIFFNNRYKQIDEVVEALDTNLPVLKWQDFLDKYLMENRELIAICGTHGKTSTTTITANLLEDLGYKISAIIGGINPRWDATFQNSDGKYFVCEADEYGSNFHSYHPNYVIFNNIEMEHPEYFNNYVEYENNFINFFKNIKREGALVFNYDDKNALETILKARSAFFEQNIRIVGFSQKTTKSEYEFIKIKEYKPKGNSSFVFNNVEYNMKNIGGEHNIFNVVGVLSLADELKLRGDFRAPIENAVLPKRRMELVLNKGRIKLYDDYAHHHTQVYYNISSLRQIREGGEKIIAILEPHLISRFEQNPKEYLDFMEMADYPIITKFFKSRESFLPDLDMSKYLKDRRVVYIEDFSDVLERVKEIINLKENVGINFRVVVMGAGLSYKLTENIKNFYAQE